MNAISRILSLASLSLLLSGCAATSEIIKGPDGTPHQLVTCGQVKECYNKAAEVCEGGYKIINTSNEVSGNEGKTSSTTHMLVKCEK